METAPQRTADEIGVKMYINHFHIINVQMADAYFTCCLCIYGSFIHFILFKTHNVFHCLIFVFVLEASLCTALSDSDILDYQGL